MLDKQLYHKLFNRWVEIQLDIAECKSIVQNMIPVSKDEIASWDESISTLIRRLIILRKDTLEVLNADATPEIINIDNDPDNADWLRNEENK